MATKRRVHLLDRLSIVLLAATGLVCLCYLALLALPASLNPLAAPTVVVMADTPTPRPTTTPLPPTPLPTDTPTPRLTNTPVIPETPTPTGPTNTPRPTNTRVPTRTPTPTYGPSPTPSPTRSKYPFTADLLPGASPYGCNWSGIAGAVFDLEGKPLVGYLVHVIGDAEIDKTVTTGNSQFKMMPGYGDSAWDVPINASGLVAGTWHVQLYQPGTNRPISDNYEVKLQAACGGSFVFVKFVQNH